jgi:hypothetical protein
MTVQCEVQDKVALLSLDDSQRFNALSSALVRSALQALDALKTQDVRACLSRLPPEQWQEGLSAFVEKRTPQYERFWQADVERG